MRNNPATAGKPETRNLKPKKNDKQERFSLQIMDRSGVTLKGLAPSHPADDPSRILAG